MIATGELRHHKGRFVATLLAVAISVGFMASASIIVATMQESMAQRQTAYLAHAQVVVEAYRETDAPVSAEQFAKVLRAIPGVTATQQLRDMTDAVKFGDRSTMVDFQALPEPEFRWSKLVEGTLPHWSGEAALSQKAMAELGAHVGDTLRLTGYALDVKVVGVTDDPSTLYSAVGYVSAEGFAKAFQVDDQLDGRWLVRTDAGAAESVVKVVKAGFAGMDLKLSAKTAQAAIDASRQSFLGQYQVWKWILWTFAGIAMVVGMITISNTFSILLAQRRRQIGLLRAIGASGAQVRHSVFAEAAVLGVVGSVGGVLLGALVALVGCAVLDVLSVGLRVPWSEVATAAALGVVITLAAAVLPTLRSTRVAPLEALRPVAAASQQRASVLRGVVCGLLSLLGAALIYLGLSGTENVLLTAVAGSALLAVGVLFAAPLFVPWLLRAVAALVGLFGPTPRLAAKNVTRNPKRAAATATALMLAMGLIVTLQVGSASVRQTVMDQISTNYPIDIQVTGSEASAEGALTKAVQAEARQLDQVEAGVVLQGGNAKDADGDTRTVLRYDPAIPSVVRSAPGSIPDDVALVRSGVAKNGETLTLGGVKLTAQVSAMAQAADAIVSPAVFDRIVNKAYDKVIWLSVRDQANVSAAYLAEQEFAAAHPQLAVDGSLMMSAGIEEAIFMVMAFVSALLGVAVLIALVGVSNTLTLSVLERKRESALMRALGLQKSGLRLMLLVEALLLAGVGALVGVVAGSFYGWVGVTALSRDSLSAGGDAKAVFSVDWGWTLTLIAAAVLVAACASILPGRRAAAAPPVQALQDI
ncbi:MAG: FtsX-like permease family protein [Propionibacteriaceae bacterium]|jgi:putative ABC transport system permease protein|nr:FtsX-like permease family protein [Propionibacteriaceae bacterium]